MELLVLLLVGGLYLALPFLITRTFMQSAATTYGDPRGPLAAQAVRRTAGTCVAVAVLGGLAFSGWCYYRSLNCPGDGWMDLEELLWQIGCALPVWPVFMVFLAAVTPVRVKVHLPAANLGFRR